MVHRQTEVYCQVTHILCIEVKKPQTKTVKTENTHDFLHFYETREGGKSKVCPVYGAEKRQLFYTPGVEDYKGSNNGL